ncbi:MAG TPA: glycosyltransferase family 39 protein [Puia sp.]|uniref:glycosyltransferase family 39 protein n=1 Tax=Puia sp. TaxID=2045100 RepID=UPI002BB7C0D4|nr:glycosyltransferase family 39 protein [Puia sp.]HVU98895.1 glycosyltransferase family 39 protein [Puia sp.]
MFKIDRKRSAWLLIFLILAVVLRIYKLDLDSFWLDELYVANEADPHHSLTQLFLALKSYDQHPPLFYLAERCFFYFFGESEFSARVLPAAAGAASIFAIYLLGREVASDRLGWTAAALTVVNHFHIHYSREARGYAFAFLFGTLSLVYLLRLLKHLRLQDVWLFSLFGLLTMYSHYFGVLLVLGEFCAAMLLFARENEKPLFVRRFALSALLITAGYWPWLPVFLSLGAIRAFWINPLPGDWPIRYFGHYFGDFPGLAWCMAALLAVYLTGVLLRRRTGWPHADRSALTRSLVALGVPTLLCYTIPYFRGLIVTPMLTERYTIVVLPCLLIFVAYGIQLIPWVRARGIVLGLLIGTSLAGELFISETWSKPHKTQFREVTAFMAADPNANHYPILCERVGGPEAYYLHKMHYPGPLLEGPRASVIDSIAKDPLPAGQSNGFWLMDAHSAGDPGKWLDSATRKKVDSEFVKVKEGRFLDAWAQLYVRRPSATGATHHSAFIRNFTPYANLLSFPDAILPAAYP